MASGKLHACFSVNTDPGRNVVGLWMVASSVHHLLTDFVSKELTACGRTLLDNQKSKEWFISLLVATACS